MVQQLGADEADVLDVRAGIVHAAHERAVTLGAIVRMSRPTASASAPRTRRTPADRVGTGLVELVGVRASHEQGEEAAQVAEVDVDRDRVAFVDGRGQRGTGGAGGGRMRAERSVRACAHHHSAQRAASGRARAHDDADDVTASTVSEAPSSGRSCSEPRRRLPAVGGEHDRLRLRRSGLEGLDPPVTCTWIVARRTRAATTSPRNRSNASNMSAGSADEGEARDRDCERGLRSAEPDRAEHDLPSLWSQCLHLRWLRVAGSRPEVRMRQRVSIHQL